MFNLTYLKGRLVEVAVDTANDVTALAKAEFADQVETVFEDTVPEFMDVFRSAAAAFGTALQAKLDASLSTTLGPCKDQLAAHLLAYLAQAQADVTALLAAPADLAAVLDTHRAALALHVRPSEVGAALRSLTRRAPEMLAQAARAAMTRTLDSAAPGLSAALVRGTSRVFTRYAFEDDDVSNSTNSTGTGAVSSIKDVLKEEVKNAGSIRDVVSTLFGKQVGELVAGLQALMALIEQLAAVLSGDLDMPWDELMESILGAAGGGNSTGGAAVVTDLAEQLFSILQDLFSAMSGNEATSNATTGGNPLSSIVEALQVRSLNPPLPSTSYWRLEGRLQAVGGQAKA